MQPQYPLMNFEQHKTSKKLKLDIPAKLERALHAVTNSGGRVFAVGGYVRNSVLGMSNKGDLDFEVYGITLKEVQRITSRYGKSYLTQSPVPNCKFVFRQGVEPADLSMPKVGVGKFAVDASPVESFQFRDLTVNAGAVDIESWFLYDFTGRFLLDISRQVLDPINEKTYISDPIRFLRAAQFVSRLDFEVSNDLISLAKKNIHLIPAMDVDRVHKEFRKLVRGKYPGKGLFSLRVMDWFDVFRMGPTPLTGYLTMREMEGIGRVRREAESMGLKERDIECITFAALSHEMKGMRNAYERMRFPKDMARKIDNLVTSIQEAVCIGNAVDVKILAKHSKYPLPVVAMVTGHMESEEAGQRLLRLAKESGTDKGHIPPILEGGDLVPNIMPQGPQVGQILEEAYRLQMQGGITTKEEGLEWARKKLQGDK